MFFGKNKDRSVRDEDKLWSERTRKYDGILEDSEDLIKEDHSVLIVFHFEETKDEIQTLLHNRKRAWNDLISAIDLSKWTDGYFSNKICMVRSDLIINSISENDSVIQTHGKLYIIVAEHYPLLERDEDVIAWTQKISPCTMCFHESLDSGLLRTFGSDKIASLLEKMSWDKNTFMSHSFITKAVENAQRKISERATGDVRAESDQKWFEYNYDKPLDSIQS